MEGEGRGEGYFQLKFRTLPLYDHFVVCHVSVAFYSFLRSLETTFLLFTFYGLSDFIDF